VKQATKVMIDCCELVIIMAVVLQKIPINKKDALGNRMRVMRTYVSHHRVTLLNSESS
jgi:hypothetical protein